MTVIFSFDDNGAGIPEERRQDASGHLSDWKNRATDALAVLV